MSQSARALKRSVPLPEVRVRIDRSAAAWAAEIGDGTAWRRLHSREPMGEARTRAAVLLAGRPSTVVLIGAGLGYLPEAILDLASEVRVLVVEPVADLALAALARRDWRTLLESGRLVVRTWPACDEPAPLWQLFDRDEPEPTVAVHPVLADLAPVAVQQIGEVVARTIFEGRANADARRRQAGRYLLNTLGNFDAIAGSADAGALKDALAGTPAIVVAAGPSLDRDLAAIAGLQDRAAIIAVDTALRPVLNAGIQPPLAIALDPSELNGTHLLDLPPHDSTWLVAEPSVAPRAVRGFSDRLFTFRVANHHPWPWLASHGVERHLVRVWGSVLTAALDLAIFAGADPIVFVGADLAFTHGQPYCRNATWEWSWAEQTGRGVSFSEIWSADLAARPTDTALDIHGEPTLTTPHLVAFRDWLIGRMAAESGRRFVNATGAGLLHGLPVLQGSLDDLALRPTGVRSRVTAQLRGCTHVAARRKAATASVLADGLRDQQTEARRDWLDFGRATMSDADLERAIETSRAELIHPTTPEAVEPRPAGLMAAADRAARLHSALKGRAVLDSDSSAVHLGDAFAVLQALCETLRRPGGLPVLRPELARDGGRVPVSLLCAGPRPLQDQIDRFEQALARAIVPFTTGEMALPFDASALERDVALPLLLAHEWLSVAAAELGGAPVNAPATILWALEGAIESATARGADMSVAPLHLEVRVDGGLSIPIAANPSSLMSRLTGLTGLWSSRPLSSSSPIVLRPASDGRREPSLALFDLPLIRVEHVQLSPSAITPTGGQVLTAEPLDGDGQCPARESSGHWTAVAHPCSDVVRLTGPRGISARLAVRCPLTVRWAEGSLAVCTKDGQELLFPMLTDRLVEATQ